MAFWVSFTGTDVNKLQPHLVSCWKVFLKALKTHQVELMNAFWLIAKQWSGFTAFLKFFDWTLSFPVAVEESQGRTVFWKLSKFFVWALNFKSTAVGWSWNENASFSDNEFMQYERLCVAAWHVFKVQLVRSINFCDKPHASVLSLDVTLFAIRISFQCWTKASSQWQEIG